MKGFLKDIFFPEYHGIEPEFIGGGHKGTSAGTLILQRVDYLAEDGEPFLSSEQHRVFAKLIREVDPVTKEQMIVHNLLQVINIALRYTNRGLGLPDLVHQGNEGLIQALKRYEPESLTCFSSFVTLCVCQHINLAILNQKGPLNPVRFTPTAHSRQMMGQTI